MTRLLGGHRSRSDRGQALPEFALVAPILFLLLFGVIQVGLLMAAQNGLVNGVRDSARRAATYRINDQSLSGSIFNAVCDSVRTELENRLADSIPGFNPDPARLDAVIQYEWSPDPTTGEYSLIANVTVTYSAPMFIPLVSGIFDSSNPDSFDLSASEQMRVENPAIAPASTSTVVCPP